MTNRATLSLSLSLSLDSQGRARVTFMRRDGFSTSNIRLTLYSQKTKNHGLTDRAKRAKRHARDRERNTREQPENVESRTSCSSPYPPITTLTAVFSLLPALSLTLSLSLSLSYSLSLSLSASIARESHVNHVFTGFTRNKLNNWYSNHSDLFLVALLFSFFKLTSRRSSFLFDREKRASARRFRDDTRQTRNQLGGGIDDSTCLGSRCDSKAQKLALKAAQACGGTSHTAKANPRKLPYVRGPRGEHMPLRADRAAE